MGWGKGATSGQVGGSGGRVEEGGPHHTATTHARLPALDAWPPLPCLPDLHARSPPLPGSLPPQFYALHLDNRAGDCARRAATVMVYLRCVVDVWRWGGGDVRGGGGLRRPT